ncbi:hypothetical protein TEA_001225 [Camellia sinensis var. sinensis]|uniref:CID domain-containing protein n=1 Tax=Camellia sinensis var. sinensis TaxID=542762 RepID=A0A4S4DHV9_CAMSN|nr:hypothetical protein TEA_001225 [Camellia sinensis var. sinensis]
MEVDKRVDWIEDQVCLLIFALLLYSSLLLSVSRFGHACPDLVDTRVQIWWTRVSPPRLRRVPAKKIIKLKGHAGWRVPYVSPACSRVRHRHGMKSGVSMLHRFVVNNHRSSFQHFLAPPLQVKEMSLFDQVDSAAVHHGQHVKTLMNSWKALAVSTDIDDIFLCIKAELVVATWDKQFHSSQMVQKIPLLNLANDILQNSKRKGNEFVSEFWKVLPAALKDVNGNNGDHGKNVVSRLVDIWEQRRVFGSRARSLKDLMLGEQVPPPLEFSRKRSRPVKIVKRDSRSIRTSEHSSEDGEMSKCKSAIQRVRKMDEEVDLACSKAKDPKRNTLSKELEDEENALKQSIEKLKLVEANRVALVSQLREALHEQESELENVRTQMQVAQAQAEEASNMRKRLDDENYVSVSKQSTTIPPSIDAITKAGKPTKKTAADIAAEVADKLAASSSSQYIMTSVLSTFAAEEAKNAGLTKSSSASSFLPLPNNSVTNMPPQQPTAPPSNTYQSILMPQMTLQSQTPTSQTTQYRMLPTLSPQQYLQLSGGFMNSYAYGSIPPLPPPPPPPPPPPQQAHMVSPVVPLAQQAMQMSQQHSVPVPQQPPAPPSFRPLGFIQPSGMVYYGLPHHSQ